MDILFNELPPLTGMLLVLLSFFTSFLTAALGIGGGVLLLAVMANVFPPVALIPVHGVIQFGSNIFRTLVMLAHVHWRPVALFGAGAVLGVALGGSVAVSLHPGWVQLGIGAFVIWSTLRRPPAWLTRWPVLTGGVTSFLTMFFGATGPFVANFVKGYALPRMEHAATHGAMMVLQHVLKTLAFGTLGFAFAPWLGFIALMIASGFLGTLAGRAVLVRISDAGFRRALNVVLVVVSLRLIWTGGRAVLGL